MQHDVQGGDRQVTLKNRLARITSILAHPFVMIVTLIAAAGNQRGSGNETMNGLTIVMLVGIAPVGAAMYYLVKKGRWANVDASNPKERLVFFLIVLAATGAMLLCLYLIEPRSSLFGGALAISLMMVLALAMLPIIKLSLHMAFATLTATLLALLGSPVAYVVFAVIPALAWSRLALGRHKAIEIVVGTLLGGLTAFMLFHGD